MATRAALALLLALLLFLAADPLAMLVYRSLHTTPPGDARQVNVIALVMLALVFLFRFGERRLVRRHLG